MSDEIVFSDPPPAKKRKGWQYSALYEACRANPGRWAEYPGVVQAKCARPTGFEFTQRRIDGKNKVWLRYIGDGGEP
jgi:hypothetical protein